MGKKYFGTDGIRGKVGAYPITPDFILKLGWAMGRVLARESGSSVLVGKDTRISGYMFESALEAGLSAAGVDIKLLGPMPTPAIAYLTRTLRAQAGIVISASHNPYYDNGIKFFSASGRKLPDEIEEAIEEELDRPMETVDSALLGKAVRLEDAAGRYIEFCKSTFSFGASLRGLRIVVDCANGATYHVAPSVFRELGAEVTAIGVEPDGQNINEDCGSTQPRRLQAKVLEQGADLGIALDGDGDRLIMVDHKGEVVDGDELLFVIARFRRMNEGMNGGVVGTVMSNLGLEHALGANGITLERVPVGDRYVLERMLQTGWNLGGESSGHIICMDKVSTGDGIVAALQVLKAMVASEQSLHTLKSGMNKYPQFMINVPLPRPIDLNRSEPVQQAVSEAELQLADKGRVLLRPSGTEPVVRVMVEGSDAPQVEQITRFLAEAVSEAVSNPEF